MSEFGRLGISQHSSERRPLNPSHLQPSPVLIVTCPLRLLLLRPQPLSTGGIRRRARRRPWCPATHLVL